MNFSRVFEFKTCASDFFFEYLEVTLHSQFQVFFHFVQMTILLEKKMSSLFISIPTVCFMT